MTDNNKRLVNWEIDLEFGERSFSHHTLKSDFVRLSARLGKQSCLSTNQTKVVPYFDCVDDRGEFHLERTYRSASDAVTLGSVRQARRDSRRANLQRDPPETTKTIVFVVGFSDTANPRPSHSLRFFSSVAIYHTHCAHSQAPRQCLYLAEQN